MTTKRTIPVSAAQSEARAVMARMMAEALVTAIDNAQQEGRPLTQLQQEDIATMFFMAHAQHVHETQRVLAGKLV